MILFAILVLSFGLSYILTGLIAKFALKADIVDDPKSAPKRKQQKVPVPLLGGLGFMFSAIFCIILLYISSLFLPSLIDATYYSSNIPNLNNADETLIRGILDMTNEGNRLFWVFISIFILGFVGILDDKYHLSAKWQILSMVVYISVALVGADLVIDQLSYPFSQLIPDIYSLKFFLSFAWIFLCVNATKILDGLDGLVGLVGFTGFILIVAVSFLPSVGQALPGIIALIWAFSILGFLPHNFPNARLYLGEGGSEVVGFLLAIFSLWSGAKVATVTMGIGLFILDIILVVLLRLRQNRSPFSGDRFASPAF
jgi:UDP-GlcNAc:undecaprenyl-phosphate GlcNAc-1-phosphate transferase